ncbi:MAG: peptidylprolyl isomerase [Chloroflexi bacterium]|nr:peptidylprolyl isomerase [Chloroflexota bacterium]
MRQRRAAERGHLAARASSPQGTSRSETERSQRRLLVIAASVIGLFVVGLLTLGWYTSSYQPPRRVVAEIDGEPVRLRDVVPYAKLVRLTTGQLAPTTARNVYARDRVLRLLAGELGVSVTPAEVEETLARRFEPPAPPDVEPSVVLTEAGLGFLQEFLDAVDITGDDYRAWTEGQLLTEAYAQHFSDAQPETIEQVFVHWIVAANSVDAQTALERIASGDDFAAVATDLSVDTVIADEAGEVGWVPRGAFPEFDPWLYDPELEVGEPIGPLVTTIGSVVLLVSDGPSEQPLDQEMRDLLGQTAFQEWLNEQTLELVTLLELDFDDAQWVVDQLVAG